MSCIQEANVRRIHAYTFIFVLKLSEVQRVLVLCHTTSRILTKCRFSNNIIWYRVGRCQQIYVRFNPLVPKEQRVPYKVCASSPEVCNADTKTLDTALAVIQGTKPSPKVSASPKHAAKSRCDTGNQSSFNNLPNSFVQECARFSIAL